MSQFQHFASIEEDDHQSRLEECKTFFHSMALQIENQLKENANNVQKSEYRVDETNNLHDKVLFFLYDRWSVIRMHSFKSLRELTKRITKQRQEDFTSTTSNIHQSAIPEFINELISTWKKHVVERQRSWQDLHGCLLGLTAIIDVLIIRNPEYSEEIPDLMDICVDIMSHVRNPIRDAAKDCLVKIGASPMYRRDLFPTLLSTIDDLAAAVVVAHGEIIEAATLKVDGLLGALVEIVPLMRSEIRLEIDSHLSSPRIMRKSSTISSLAKLSTTIRLCMKHPASTVRQKAGCIISSIMKLSVLHAFSCGSTSGDGNSAAQFAYLSKEVLVSSLKDKEVEAWQSQEVCLIVSEELIREAISQYLMSVTSIDGGNPSQQLSSISIMKTLNELSEFLQSHLHDLLSHPRFEVRRVVLQLLPTLARGRIVLFSSIQCDIGNESIVTNEEIPEHHPSVESFRLMVDMVWLSTMIKESRHLYEVLYKVAVTMSSNYTDEIVHQSSEIESHAGENWSLEVHGRLLEVELRADFHKQLENVAANPHGIQILCESLVGCSTLILSLLNKLFNDLDVYNEADNFIFPRSALFYSVDYIELMGLCHCFVFTVIYRFSDMFQIFYKDVNHQDSLNSKSQKDMLISADNLRDRICSFNYSWITVMVFLQLNSASQQTPASGGSIGNGSAISSSNYIINSHFTSFAANRPTSTELVVLWLMQRNRSDDSNFRELVALKQNGMEFDLNQHIRLLPTLTDPATNPILYTEDLVSPMEYRTEDDHQQFKRSHSRHATPYSSPLRIQVSSSGKERILPVTPNNHQSGSVYFPPLTPGVSVKSPSITSPNRVGVGCNLPVNSSISTYHSMNRWNCEAMSPLLYNISCNLRDLGSQDQDHGFHRVALLLACIAAEWQINVMLDPLWLDHRKFAKRTLMESLPILLEVALVRNDEHDDGLKCLQLYVTRTLAEVMCIESRQNKMDLKWLSPIVRAIDLCLTTSVNFDIVTASNDALFANSHRLPYQIQDLLSQIGECLHVALNALISRGQATLIVSINANSSLEGGNSMNSLSAIKSSDGAFQRFPDLEDGDTEKIVSHNAEASTAEDSAVLEDEFSDWDDEDDEEENLTRTDTCNSALSMTLVNISIIQSMESLQLKVVDWRRNLLEKHGIE